MDSEPSVWSAMVSSSEEVWSVSARKKAVSVRVMAIHTLRITPVRPLPPTVAQKRVPCGSSEVPPGSRVRIRPSATSSSMRMTWLPNDPAEWWFLPWMSWPIAPPTVT